jgi:DNA-binding transcriptional ArsR family regulator
VDGIRRLYHYLKDFFQIPGGPMARQEMNVRVTDPRALHALAHPTRVALLDHLLAMGARTASQCAEAVGQSASSCSWHMRQLARFGFVERAESADGRERPWRATATGFGYEPGRAGPGGDRLENAVLATQLRAEEQALVRHLEARSELAPAWQEASVVHTYHLLMTPDELESVQARLDRSIRPFIALTRADPPEDAGRIRLHVRAYRSGDDG